MYILYTYIKVVDCIDVGNVSYIKNIFDEGIHKFLRLERYPYQNDFLIYYEIREPN